jgi:hypothetical protein
VLDIKFPGDADSLNVLIDLIDPLATILWSVSQIVSLGRESLPSHLYPRLKNIIKMKNIADLCWMLGS